MSEHVIEDGESAESVAARYGLPLAKLWDYGGNAELKKKRQDPHLLHPGDVLQIPPLALKSESLATGQRHKITVNSPKSKLALQFKKYGKPRADLRYVLTVDGKELKKGKTDGDGKVVAEVPALARAATLLLGEGTEQVSYKLKLRGIHAAAEVSGWEGRLANLGYPVGKVDDTASRESEAALWAFQHVQKLEAPSGKADQATRDKLKEVYGC
jgi:hypothetical protein